MSGLSVDERWSRFVTPGREDECWEWQGARIKGGYGTFRIAGKKTTAHRAALIRRGVSIPPGMEVCHTCDNPPCVNPAHLYVGTHSQNIQDMIRRSRRNDQRGEAHFRAVVPDDLIAVILARHQAGETQTALAREYGIDQTSISDWKLGKARTMNNRDMPWSREAVGRCKPINV